jgi:hypothetical protein
MAIVTKPASDAYRIGFDRIFGYRHMYIYLAGGMRHHKDFNRAAFAAAAETLRQQGHTVFNPSERDIECYGLEAMTSETGDEREVALKIAKTPEQFTRECFQVDTDWICRYADAVYLLPGWQTSKGAIAERALAEALGLEIKEL